MVARPDDPPKRKAWAATAIRELRPKCQKLLMNPTACYGCPSNPIKQNQDIDRELYQVYSRLIDTASRLLDAIKYGWVKGEDITPFEFSLVRIFDRAVQSRRVL